MFKSRLVLLLAWLLDLGLACCATGQISAPLRVRLEVARGPFFVGQGFDMRVGVVAADTRPRLDVPPLAGARTWTIGTEFEPITVSGIGSIVAQENVFLTRFRVLPSRSGLLEIPPIRAQLGNRFGRSQPRRLSIQRVPLEGRPAEFLGGVGQFELEAEATPNVVRVGQDLEFRITVTGPAAWGMTGHPDIARFGRLPIGLTIERQPDLATDEPAARTFVYRLRPSRARDAVLPPVAIAAFDPAAGRFVTHVTAGVPVRVVAVPSFDPATLDTGALNRDAPRLDTVARTAWVCSTAALVASFVALKRLRRARRATAHGPVAARRYAARLARSLGSPRDRFGRLGAFWRKSAQATRDSAASAPEAARHVSEELIRYLELGAGRAPGALTPDEARQSVAQLTGSSDLGERAQELTALCDLALYGNVHVEPTTAGLVETARQLFEDLGRVKTTRGGS